MSFNQSRSDKSDTQYRKLGRSAGSNHQRTSSGHYGKGGGGAGPALSPSSSSSVSSNRSFKKSNNAQGGQSRVNVQAVNSSDHGNSSAPRHVQNGAHSQPLLHGPGDASKAFPFQFGSISPGFMNGMQIPVRTSSAPPNLDEQKRDQALNDTFRPAPPLPIPPPKQQLPRKDMGTVGQSNAVEAYPVPKAKKDIQVSVALPVSQTQKSAVLPMPMSSMQMPFHQSPVSVQFGGPNLQIQPQGVPPTSLQVPMPMAALPMGSAPQVQQRATNFQQRGLIPSPQTPMQIMHKAERKYEAGKITGEEQAKQRQLKAVLNKLTPQNFEKVFEQVKAVNIDNAVTLTCVISQIFDKVLMKPTFCEMYANFFYHLAGELPDFTENNEKVTFKRLLLNKCQEEFERGEREQEEANKAEEEGETKQSAEQREEKRTNARRRMLGNIRLIGELYKKKMLTERIMHECIKKLLGQVQNPDELDVEALCTLMSTIGERIDHPKAKVHLDAYFDKMFKLSNNMKLSSRVRFMLKDAIDLRRNKWQQGRKVESPKKIDEVHRDAAQERHHQSSRLSLNPTINPSPRRMTMDFGPRGSGMVFSPNAQIGGFHGLPAKVRGFGNQDVCFEERHI